MAQFSNTFETANLGSGVSNREDLTDVLTILAPEETPILSSANKKKDNNNLYFNKNTTFFP